MEILGFLSHGFIQKALLAGSFIAISCSTLGVFLVLRRLSLIGDGLAHVTFGGVAMGMLFGVLPLYAAIPVVMASSIAILKLVERARLFGDAAIGMVSSLGIAGGIILASVAGGFNIDLFSYLFGNILAISGSEVITSMGVSMGVIVMVLLLFHELFSLTFDEESARASGIKTGRINMILVLLTGPDGCSRDEGGGYHAHIFASDSPACQRAADCAKFQKHHGLRFRDIRAFRGRRYLFVGGAGPSDRCNNSYTQLRLFPRKSSLQAATHLKSRQEIGQVKDEAG